nr:DoxX family membrane protein [Polynucleobacter necessarius]
MAIAALFLPAGLNKFMGVEGTTGYFASLGLPAVVILVWQSLQYWLHQVLVQLVLMAARQRLSN